MPKKPQANRLNPEPRQGIVVVTRPGRPGFYLRGTVRGRTIFESAGTDNRALAEEARSARETELYRAAIFGEKTVAELIRFNVAAHSYLTNQEHSVANQARVARVVKHFGPKVTCDAIRQAEVDEACAKLCRADAQPATKLREVVAPVKAILTHAARRGWCSVPVFERMKSAGKRTEWFTPDQAEAMIAAAPPNAAAWLTFFFCTGARVNEMICLEWQDVDLQHARVVLRDTKNGDDRNVDLPPRAVAMLASMSPARRAGRVFRNKRGLPYRATEDSGTIPYGGQLQDEFAAVLKSAGITANMTPHHTRHSWASWFYVLDRDLLRLKQAGGWGSVALVERYAHLCPPTMADAVRALWNTTIRLAEAA